MKRGTILAITVPAVLVIFLVVIPMVIFYEPEFYEYETRKIDRIDDFSSRIEKVVASDNGDYVAWICAKGYSHPDELYFSNNDGSDKQRVLTSYRISNIEFIENDTYLKVYENDRTSLFDTETHEFKEIAFSRYGSDPFTWVSEWEYVGLESINMTSLVPSEELRRDNETNLFHHDTRTNSTRLLTTIYSRELPVSGFGDWNIESVLYNEKHHSIIYCLRYSTHGAMTGWQQFSEVDQSGPGPWDDFVPGIYSIDLTTNVTKLLYENGRKPVQNDDHSKILFQTNWDLKFHLGIMDSNGENARVLTSGEKCTGKYFFTYKDTIIYNRDVYQGPEIREMDLDGSNDKRLSPHGSFYLLAISPDGKNVYYRRIIEDKDELDFFDELWVFYLDKKKDGSLIPF